MDTHPYLNTPVGTWLLDNGIGQTVPGTATVQREGGIANLRLGGA